MIHTTSLLVQFMIIILGLSSAQGLTIDDFYTDNNAPIVESSLSGSPSDYYDLPVTIRNLRGQPKPATYYYFIRGYLIMEGYDIKILKPANRVMSEGETSLKESTDAELLRRALDDITATGNLTNVLTSSVAPTHLLLYNNIGFKGVSSSENSTFQFVLATNGNYTYGIILFVSVEPAAINDEARVQLINTPIYDLPYTSDILNAPMNSNVGVPGKYVIDMNENPPPLCGCQARLKKLACEAVRLRSETLPASCNDIN